MKQGKKEAIAGVLPTKSSKSRAKKTKPPTQPVSIPASQPVATAGNKGVVKEDLISKILKYQNNKRFGTIINKELGFKYTRNQLVKYSVDNIETILHRIRTHLNTRNMDQVFEHMARVTAKGYEDLITGFGYNIEGFSELLLANPSFHDSFERWKIERQVPDVPPSFQLMYIVASTTYMAHMTNKQMNRRNEVIKEPKQQEVIKKEVVKKEVKKLEKQNEERIKLYDLK